MHSVRHNRAAYRKKVAVVVAEAAESSIRSSSPNRDQSRHCMDTNEEAVEMEKEKEKEMAATQAHGSREGEEEEGQ